MRNREKKPRAKCHIERNITRRNNWGEMSFGDKSYREKHVGEKRFFPSFRRKT